jgi:hypothetical protein
MSFSLTTDQAHKLCGLSKRKLYTDHQRYGSCLGIVPTKLKNGRLLWPRAEILALKGLKEVGRDASIDLRAWIAVFENYGHTPDDLMASQAADILNPFHSDRVRPECIACEEMVLLAQLNKVILDRLMRVWSGLDAESKRWARSSLAKCKLEVLGADHAVNS